MQNAAVRRLYFDGSDGRFVDASGGQVLRVGRWQLRSDQQVQTLNRLGNNPPEQVFGPPRQTLETGGDCLSEFIEGELRLPMGPVQVCLTLLDCYINEVEPPEARDALAAALRS